MAELDVDARAELIQFLASNGFVLEPVGDSFTVTSRTDPLFLSHRPLLVAPGDLIAEYLVDLSASLLDEPDPLREALALTLLNAVEYLTVDHGGGRNALRAFGFRRGRDGRVEFFEEKDPYLASTRADPDGEYAWVADPRAAPQ